MLASPRMASVGLRKRDPVQVGLVVALTSPVQPGRVVERLGSLLYSLGVESVASSLVDACSVGEPLARKLKRWSRRLDRSFDPELESFAFGLGRLLRQHEPQIVVLATDALLERTDEELACFDRYALDFAAVTRRTLGFLEVANPSSSPDKPRRYRYANDLVVLPSARPGKREGAAAILDRLQTARQSYDVFDLRVVRRMAEARLDARRMSSAVLVRFAGPVGLELGRPTSISVRHALDSSVFPPEVRHGDPVPVRIQGWANAVPPVRTVEVRAGASLLSAPLTVHRPDVLAAGPELLPAGPGAFESGPELLEEVCGFDLAGDLGPFRPGRYAVVWSVPGSPVSEMVGSFRVQPTLEIERLETLAPSAVPPEEPVPVGVRGTVRSTEPATVRVVVDGHELETVTRVASRDERGERPDQFEFRAQGVLELSGEDHVVEARCRDESGAEVLQRAAFRVERAPGAPLRWETRTVGALDPRTRRTPLHLAGTLFSAAPGERVAVRSGGRTLAETSLLPWGEGGASAATGASGATAAGRGLARFEIRDEVAGLDAGEARLELVRRNPDGEEVELDAWGAAVGVLGFGLEVSSLKTVPLEAGDVRLIAEGTVEPGHLLDSLLLYVDGELRARLGGEWLLPAAASEGPSARFHRFRIDYVLALAPGAHRFELHTRRGTEEQLAWGREVEVPRAEVGAGIRLRSADLDRLLRDSPNPVWSRLAIRGEAVGGRPGDRVELILGAEPAAAATLAEGGEFALVAHPAAGELLDARLRVSRRGEEIASSPSFAIVPRRLAVPPECVAQLEALLSRLLPSPAPFDRMSCEQVLAALFESETRAIGGFRRALELLDERTRLALTRPGEVVLDPPDLPSRALEVLFVAWEPPCHLHGGGVAIRNLLRAVGERHRVTLVHTLAPGEEGLSDEVRPWVREILPMRREWRVPHLDPGFGVPESHAWSYSPAFRAAIEGELATGRYDLFNGDFLRTALHVDASRSPSVGVAHEIDSYAAVATVPARFDEPAAAAEWLATFLRSLWFESVFAPSRFSEFATLTEPEARFLARVLPERRLFVTPIPIDTEALGAVAALREPAPAPVFLFFGNFIHPPNRDAARLLADEIAPAVTRLRPECRFVIAGANPPAELVAREGRHGVHVPGYVPDLGSLTATATAFLAPIFEGAGMRVKLLEALAAGCPVVSTPLGFSGIDGEAGVTWLEARSVEEFVAAAMRLAEDAALARGLSEEGRRFVEREFGIAVQGARRERIWQATLAAASGSNQRASG